MRSCPDSIIYIIQLLLRNRKENMLEEFGLEHSIVLWAKENIIWLSVRQGSDPCAVAWREVRLM